jgi:hypothetical protein
VEQERGDADERDEDENGRRRDPFDPPVSAQKRGA